MRDVPNDPGIHSPRIGAPVDRRYPDGDNARMAPMRDWDGVLADFKREVSRIYGELLAR